MNGIVAIEVYSIGLMLCEGKEGKSQTVVRFIGHLALTRRMFISWGAGRCIWFR